MPRTGLVAGGYTPSVKDFMENGTFICDRPPLLNQVFSLFASCNLAASNRIRNCFVLIIGHDIDQSVLSVSRAVLLLN